MDWREKAKRKRLRARMAARLNGPVVMGMGLFMFLGIVAQKDPIPATSFVGGVLVTILAFAAGIWMCWWGWQKDSTHRDIR